METAGGSDPVGPPRKRIKPDEPDSEETAVGDGLKSLPDCILQDTNNWCTKTFGALLDNPSTHDVTFKTSDGSSVSAHRAIVAAGSPVFHAMLYGNMAESSQKEIELSSVDSKALSTLLTFVYTGTVKIDSLYIEDVLQASHYFNIASLERHIVDFVTDSLNNANIVDIVLFAKRINIPQLFDKCLSFMFDHADSITRDISFTHLSSEIVHIFCKSSDLRIKELVLFVAVFRWYKHQDIIPVTVAKEIFQEIRYPLISESDLVNIVRPLKIADPVLYTAALEYHLVPDKYRGPLSQITSRKPVIQNIKYINVNEQNMTVSHNGSSSIIITKTHQEGFLSWNGLCAILVYPTEQQPVHFRIVLQKVDTSSRIYLVTRSYLRRPPRFQVDAVTGGIRMSGLCVQQKIDGEISVRGNIINTTINGTTETSVPKGNLTYFCIHMEHQDDKLQFLFT